jgi:excisionase family DNA binding protein
MLSVTQAAKIVGLTRDRVHKLIIAGKLPAKRLGDKKNAPYMIKKDDLKLLEGRKPGRPKNKGNIR